MVSKVLVAYATAHGSTGEIAEFIGRTLRAFSLDVRVANVEHITSISEYDLVFMGSPVHAGMWLPQLSKFMRQFENELAEKKTFMFITCIRVLETDSVDHILENYVYKPALEKLQITLKEVGIFAGKITQTSIKGDERWLLTANYDGKEMPGTFDQDYRDWQAITQWVTAVLIGFGIKPSFEREGGNITLNIPSDSGDAISF